MTYRPKHKVEWKTYTVKVPAGAALVFERVAEKSGTSVFEMLRRDAISKYCPNYMPILDNPDTVRARKVQALKRSAPKFSTVPEQIYAPYQVMPKLEDVCVHPPVKRLTSTAGTFCVCGKQINRYGQ